MLIAAVSIMDTNIIIANERAHWGLGRLRLHEAHAFFHKWKFPFSLFTTEYPSHARELAANATAQSVDTIIVIGGDGTVNEVINGSLMSSCHQIPHIGIIPSGSSNDFSKSLGIPQRVKQACQTIMAGRTRYVDIGQAGSHYFCMASSLGLFSKIAAASTCMKGLSGSLRYMAAAFKVVGQTSSGWEMSIKADGKAFCGIYCNLLVSNTRRFGGLTLVPNAKSDDGLLDCLLIEGVTKWEAPHLALSTLRKALIHHRKVTVFQAESLSVSLDPPALLNNDGEVDPALVSEIDYQVLPQKLHIIC